jgi:hypothetical protein
MALTGRAAVLAIAFALGVEGAARADEPVALRLEYRASASCPDEAALLSRIRARVAVRSALPGEEVATFGVTVQADGDRVVGRIASMSERNELTGREVIGADCSDVVDAVAFIITMALSPRAAGYTAHTGSLPSSVVGVPTDAAGASGHATSLERDRSTVNGGPGPRLELLGSAQAEVTLGYVPSALLAVGARLQVFRTRAYATGPSVAVGFAATEAVERDLPIGRASLALTTGELFVCPFSVALAPSLSLRPCARLDIGQLRAEGSGIANARSQDLFFSSAGALGQITFVPVKPLVVDAQASVLFPLTDYRFVFEPDSVIYSAPTVGLSVSLAVGVMFL